MKSFKKFIAENFTIARVNMPQIENVDAFTDWLNEQKGVGSKPYFNYINFFNPLQAEGFDETKIENIIADMRDDPENICDNKQIIVSDDGYVIDGHHRYLAAKREQVKIPYIVVYTSANKLLKLAYEYTTN